jgi:hypothetical protein
MPPGAGIPAVMVAVLVLARLGVITNTVAHFSVVEVNHLDSLDLSGLLGVGLKDLTEFYYVVNTNYLGKKIRTELITITVAALSD